MRRECRNFTMTFNGFVGSAGRRYAKFFFEYEAGDDLSRFISRLRVGLPLNQQPAIAKPLIQNPGVFTVDSTALKNSVRDARLNRFRRNIDAPYFIFGQLSFIQLQIQVLHLTSMAYEA